MALDLELLGEFLLEGNEILQRLDQDLVELEKNPRDRERLAAIFRGVHTLKGTSGFIPLPKLAALAHAGENLLGRLRDGQLEATARVISALLAMVDGLRGMLGEAEASGSDGDDPRAELIAELEASATARSAPSAAPVTEPARAAAAAQTASPTVRVDVALLDRMMNLVAELVLARNQLLRCGGSVKDAAFADASQRLNLLTTELHEGVTKTRLQPIGSLFEKLPRVVRDLAIGCGKDVTLELEGGATELDRTLLEAIKDPVTHLVRNAIDHGIESPEARVECGKRAQGWLQLRAFHQGGRVHLEVRDDGAGIDVARVREVAVQRGVIDASRAMRLSDRDVTQLIFQPGFSTASKVTQVSGRGVGMDVVKTNIERIGGTVEVQSIPGAGTTVCLTLPLTLAIVPALIVGAAGERFAVPQASLVEVVRLGEGIAGAIEHIHGAPVYRLRGSLLPLAWVSAVLELGEGDSSDFHVVVLQLGQRQFGLVVDEVFDTEEIVVKPISQELERLGVFAGATLMGDGTVALILDCAGIARHARLTGNGGAQAHSVREEPMEEANAQRESLLLFQAGAAPLAVPLSNVASIEEVPQACVSQVGGRDVIEYRGQIVPLADLGELLGRPPASAKPMLQVLMVSQSGRSLGLVVERIDDVVDEVLQSRTASTDSRLAGTAYVQGRLTELVDLREVAQRFDPRFFDARAA